MRTCPSFLRDNSAQLQSLLCSQPCRREVVLGNEVGSANDAIFQRTYVDVPRLGEVLPKGVSLQVVPESTCITGVFESILAEHRALESSPPPLWKKLQRWEIPQDTLHQFADRFQLRQHLLQTGLSAGPPKPQTLSGCMSRTNSRRTRAKPYCVL